MVIPTESALAVNKNPAQAKSIPNGQNAWRKTKLLHKKEKYPQPEARGPNKDHIADLQGANTINVRWQDFIEFEIHWTIEIAQSDQSILISYDSK